MKKETQDIIISELKKITNLIGTQKIKSFILFNVSESDKVSLFESLNDIFNNLNSKLDQRIENEKNALLENQKPRLEKYQKLKERYKDLPHIEFPQEIYNETSLEISEEISAYQTKGQHLKKTYHFNELNFEEYQQNQKRFEALNLNMDFSNLRYISDNNPRYLHYQLTKEEKEYTVLKDYFNTYHNQSLILYLEDFIPELNELLNSEFSIQYLQWYLLVFNFSKDEFDEKINDRNKYWIYSKDTLVIE